MRGQILYGAGTERLFDARPHGLEGIDAQALQKFGKHPDFAAAFFVKIEQKDASGRFRGVEVFFHLAQGHAVRAYEMRPDAQFFQGGHVAFAFDKHDFAIQGFEGLVQYGLTLRGVQCPIRLHDLYCCFFSALRLDAFAFCNQVIQRRRQVDNIPRRDEAHDVAAAENNEPFDALFAHQFGRFGQVRVGRKTNERF